MNVNSGSHPSVTAGASGESRGKQRSFYYKRGDKRGEML